MPGPSNIIARWTFVIMSLAGSIGQANAQLTVTGGQTATALAQVLAGPGITVSNATITGAAVAYGTFNGANSNIGLPSGVLLTSGSIGLAIGPNNAAGAGVGNGTPGDPRLNAIAQANTADAVVLAFDFVPLSNEISFNYVFASEEYPEWVNSGFNDAFAFFISGPGIAGAQNIAVVPGTTIPLTINTVNAGANGQYYVNNAGGATVQYDAFTTSMAAEATVQACQSYHLELLIADGGDAIFDSGVFLEEGSLTSNTIEITTTTATADSTAYENCSSATVTFTLNETVSTDYVINYNVSGTATNGTDYPMLPGTVTIPANTLSTSFTIDPVFDGVNEGVETILIDLQTSVCGSDTILVYVNDVSPVTVEAFGDTAFCGGTAMLWAAASGGAGGHTYAWSNGMTTDTIYVSPAATTTYVVTSNDFCASTIPAPTDSATVTIDPTPVADAGADISYCAGDSVTISGSGGTVFAWSQMPGSTPVSNDNPVTIGPVGDLDLQMITWIGSCSDTDLVSLAELPAQPAFAVGDTALCEGQPAQLNVEGAVNSTFSWGPQAGLSNALVQDPVAMADTSTVYTVTIVSSSGCIKHDSVEVTVNPLPQVEFSSEAVCLNATSVFDNLTTLETGAIQSYLWIFGDGDSTQTSDPTHVYATDSTYPVQLLAISDQGCSDSIQHDATVHPLPVANFNFENDCEDKLILFQDSSTVSSGIIGSWQWDFGNGSTSASENPPAQSFANDSLFNIQLNVATAFGCLDSIVQVLEVYPVPIASFMFDSVCLHIPDQFTDLSDPDGSYPITSWSWDFSDGQSSDMASPSVMFNNFGAYSATLTVTNSVGCQDDATAGDALVYPLPVARFSDQLKNCLTDTTFFTDQSTVAELLNDSIQAWSWDFADGIGSDQNSPFHVFSDYGFRDVTLISYSDKGCSDTIAHSVEIFPLPSVDFTADITEGCQPLRVLFTDLSTIPEPYSLASYEWNLGDGNGTFSAQHPMNVYDNDTLPDMGVGHYTVSLQVTSMNGCTSSDTVVDYITEYPKPEALFSVNPPVTDVLSPRITFTDLSTPNVTEWNWDFGDGGQSGEQHPIHAYPDTGIYHIVEYVTTEYGCRDTIGYQVKVEPIFTFYIPSAFTPDADGVNETFYGQGEGVSSYTMFIYDRWGEVIFTSSEQKNPWDGTFKGKQVQQGVYSYYFHLHDWQGHDHEYRGHVTLFR